MAKRPHKVKATIDRIDLLHDGSNKVVVTLNMRDHHEAAGLYYEMVRGRSKPGLILDLIGRDPEPETKRPACRDCGYFATVSFEAECCHPAADDPRDPYAYCISAETIINGESPSFCPLR